MLGALKALFLILGIGPANIGKMRVWIEYWPGKLAKSKNRYVFQWEVFFQATIYNHFEPARYTCHLNYVWSCSYSRMNLFVATFAYDFGAHERENSIYLISISPTALQKQLFFLFLNFHITKFNFQVNHTLYYLNFINLEYFLKNIIIIGNTSYSAVYRLVDTSQS